MGHGRRQVLQPLLALLLSVPLAAFALARGDAAPDIWGERLDGGGTLKLSQLRGKVVYVDFWATWCAPCRVSIPLLGKMRQELAPRGLEVLGIDVDKQPDKARMFIQAQGVEYPVLKVADSTFDWYDVSAMPSAYVIDRKGKVRMIYRGFHADEFPALRAQIEKLLEEEAQ